MPDMRSLLIANRGEIAVRIIRSAQEMGLRTIAVYSELDRDALHVDLADEAWNIGPAPAAGSYLNMDRIIEVAHEAKADAVHPGYGFLAENPTFARKVMDAGIIWVGPPPDAIATMGDKIASRKAAAQAKVESVPGTLEPLESVDDAAAAAGEFGYPVAIKAAHGGGGKGLRVVHTEDELEAAVAGARREADAYFGNPEVYVEKYLEFPRHIEAQILCDGHGHAVFLGERDCSVQRRHQKLIEETPSPGLDDKTRGRLGKAAIAVAKACGYRNAGTVEFLVDRSGSFFFLEMNTRLQVEHTVTEMVTGIDIVQEQLKIAQGRPLSIDRVKTAGHAIEFRINAEDPARDFLPNPGRVAEYREPAGFGVRVDSWIRPGTKISQYYDNLMAKLVVWGPTRTDAINRARRALGEFHIRGVATTIPAHLRVLEHPTFIEGTHHTRWAEDELDLSGIARPTAPAIPEDEAMAQREITVEIGGRRYLVTYWMPELQPASSGRRPAPRRRPPKLSQPAGNSSGEAGVVTAPMQGTIVKVHTEAGHSINAGEPICVLEAMKMENEVRSPIEGEVIDLRVRPGDTVTSGQVIAIIR
jgi:acetyl-CoA/propionyl-CoA carboxylase biotin carboxyl carrier protein